MLTVKCGNSKTTGWKTEFTLGLQLEEQTNFQVKLGDKAVKEI